MHRMTNGVLTPQIQNIHTHTCTYYAWNSRPSLPIYQHNSKLPMHFFYLGVWSSLIIGQAIIIVTPSNSQLVATNKQTSKLLPHAISLTRVNTTTNVIYIHMIIQVCTHCSMHEQWFNLWLYHCHSFLPVDKRSVTSSITWNLPLSIGVFQYYLVYYILIIFQ